MFHNILTYLENCDLDKQYALKLFDLKKLQCIICKAVLLESWFMKIDFLNLKIKLTLFSRDPPFCEVR